jgi:dual specificity protein kinase YAK1
MDQWQSYSDNTGSQRRYNNNPPAGQQHQGRDYNGAGASQPPAGFTYEQYQGGSNSHPQSMAASPTATPQMRDQNGDVAMHDADLYSGIKYPMRPHHQHHLSNSRSSSHHAPQEQSSAAQRYSPMEALSPSSPFTASPQNSQNPYGAQSASHRSSPTRPGAYSSPNSYYANRPQTQQLPPITPFTSNNESYPNSATAQLNAVFGNDPKSPRRGPPTSTPAAGGRGPVPEFTKIKSISELRPNVNAQPAFRRANPEGGFISVSHLTVSKITSLTSSPVASSSTDHSSPIYVSNLQPIFQI